MAQDTSFQNSISPSGDVFLRERPDMGIREVAPEPVVYEGYRGFIHADPKAIPPEVRFDANGNAIVRDYSAAPASVETDDDGNVTVRYAP